MKFPFPAIFILSMSVIQSSCIAVGGYSSTGGWFMWPGMGVLIIILILWFIFRSR